MNLFCCQKENYQYHLSEIQSVYPFKTGSYGNGINNVSYYVGIRIGSYSLYCLQSLTLCTTINNVSLSIMF